MTSREPQVLPVRTAGTLTDADILRILDQVPQLNGLDRTVVRVPGGLTNVNVKVTTARGPVIARIATQDSALLAIDRPAEYANSIAAARSGAAPEVVAYSAAAGVLAVRWIEGRTFDPQDLFDPANLARVVHACKLLHSGPRFVGNFDMFEIQRGYLSIVDERGFRLPPGYLDFMPQVDRIRQALAVRDVGTVPCNNDLLAANLVDDGERIWIVDFDYGGNNDACFELGNLWSESDLSLEVLDELVTLYYGARLRHKVARVRLLGLMSKYGWTLWASIQDAVSSVDFDHWSWGLEKYERAVAEFTATGFDDLLGEAIRPD